MPSIATLAPCTTAATAANPPSPPPPGLPGAFLRLSVAAGYAGACPWDCGCAVQLPVSCSIHDCRGRAAVPGALRPLQAGLRCCPAPFVFKCAYMCTGVACCGAPRVVPVARDHCTSQSCSSKLETVSEAKSGASTGDCCIAAVEATKSYWGELLLADWGNNEVGLQRPPSLGAAQRRHKLIASLPGCSLDAPGYLWKLPGPTWQLTTQVRA